MLVWLAIAPRSQFPELALSANLSQHETPLLSDGEPAQNSVAIHRFVLEYNRVLRDVLANFDISLQSYLCLAAIHELQGRESPSVRQVAERLVLQAHSVGELTRRLEEGGLVRRTRDGVDTRRVNLELTEQGRMLLAQIAQPTQAMLRQSGALAVIDSRVLAE